MSAIGIRPYDPADAHALVEAALESVREVQPWLPWCHPGITVRDAETWIESQIRAREEGTAFEFVITDGAHFLGGCGVNQINPSHRVANLGYWVRTSVMGRGIAPLAIQELVAWTFANTELRRLELLVATANERSQRAAEKSGALREGLLRARLFLGGRSHDAIIYSFVRE